MIGIALLIITGLALTGCGGGGHKLARSSAHTRMTVADSGPLVVTGSDWTTLLHSASHYGASSSSGPTAGTVRWHRDLGGQITAGPVAVGRVAYVAGNAGVLHAIDIASGKDRWTFNGAAELRV